MSQPIEISHSFPEKLGLLLRPKRFKVMYGGRGAGRSWGIADALLLKGVEKRLRILCARELQNSLAESCFLVLKDQIDRLGLGFHYEIQHDRIIGRNGTLFIFTGIKNNATKVKSFEGIDICWVEEAEKVSKNSWGVLIPTIRRPGSEIWISFNPGLSTDYTYTRFVKEAPDYPDMIEVSHMTWRDNPWFPEVLRAEKDRCRENDYDEYLNIWEGKCIEVLEGAVYAKELRTASVENRILTVPYFKEVPVDTFWDLGRADNTAIWFAQKVAMQHRILAYYEATGEDIHHFLQELQKRKYLYGRHYLPHDAKAARLGSKLTIEEIIKNAYPGDDRVKIVKKQNLSDGINAVRMILPRCFFDEDKCEDGLRALRNYKYKIVDGQRSQVPLHNWASDGADAFRYLALSLMGERREGPSVTEKLQRMSDEARKIFDSVPGMYVGTSWMGH